MKSERPLAGTQGQCRALYWIDVSMIGIHQTSACEPLTIALLFLSGA